MPSAEIDIENFFSPVTKAQWTQQLITDLKGKSVETLKRVLPEGFETAPFYTIEDLDNLALIENQLIQTTGRPLGWMNVPNVRFLSESVTNNLLRDLLTKGADGLLLDLRGTEPGEISWNRLLQGLKLSDTPIWFQVSGQSEIVANALKQMLPYQLKGGIIDEPIARYLQFGSSPVEALPQLMQATRQTLNSPHFHTITVGSHVFHNAGATATQELAFTLNAVVDLYDHLTDAGLTVEQIVPKTALSVSVGTSYFTEIAKLRALRILWQRLLLHYSTDSAVRFDSHPLRQTDSIFIHARTSTFYDSRATPYTNQVRATTEAMAAVIGGCDALTVHPYDAVFSEPDEFSSRIARNISILLKEEAHLDKTIDPSAGSYYLEILTNQLAESAWALFLKVEKMGGLSKAVESGFIQEEIEISYQAKVEAVKNGQILVGVTTFREESVASKPKPVRSEKTARRPGLPVLLTDRRLAEEFE